MTPPAWIRTPAELETLARSLCGTPALAIDTEADSLHHYPERLCLVQLADPAGRVFFLDALALPDLDALQPVLADPATVKVLHSADNDIGHLKRRYGLAFAAIWDTMLAARFLGVRELGLERLLETYLGVQAGKSQQKTDWARRPLAPAQEEYAAGDVRHLLALRERLAIDLARAGRDAWLAEECRALATLAVPPRPSEEDGFRRLRGASRLDRRGQAILRALHAQREAWARAEHRPPFKVLSPDTLVAVAAAAPATRDGLTGLPGLSPRLIERYGNGILEAVARGATDLTLVPPPTPRPARPAVPPAVRQRVEALRQWRAAAAERVGLDPGVLLPQRLIEVLAAAPAQDLDALARVPGIRQWRVTTFGAELLPLLAGNHDGTPAAG